MSGDTLEALQVYGAFGVWPSRWKIGVWNWDSELKTEKRILCVYRVWCIILCAFSHCWTNRIFYVGTFAKSQKDTIHFITVANTFGGSIFMLNTDSTKKSFQEIVVKIPILIETILWFLLITIDFDIKQWQFEFWLVNFSLMLVKDCIEQVFF